MTKGNWAAKVCQNGLCVSVMLFESEREAVAFVRRLALKLKGKCKMKMLYHTIHITEELCETYPQAFPLETKKRDIVIVEADFDDLEK